MCRAESKQQEHAAELRARIWAASDTGRSGSTTPGTRATRTEKKDAGGGWDGKPWGPSRVIPASSWVVGPHHNQAAAVPKAGPGGCSLPGALHKPPGVSGTARGSSCFEHGESSRELTRTEPQPGDCAAGRRDRAAPACPEQQLFLCR